MSCCKDNLRLFLVITEQQKNNKTLMAESERVLIDAVNFTTEQATVAVEYARNQGQCLIMEGTASEVGSVTTQLAKIGVGALVEKKAIK